MNLFIGILGLIVVLFLMVIALAFAWLGIELIIVRAPFVPLPEEVVPHVFDALDVKPGQIVFDLGCGDGRILIDGTKVEPKAQYIGVERSFLPYWIAKYRCWREAPKVKLYCENIMKTDLTKADRIFTYLIPHVMDMVLPKIQKEVRPGTRMVSVDFTFTNKEPLEVIDLHRKPGQLGKKLYVYAF